MYVPRERDELARIFLGSLITRSELDDTAQGSVIDVLAQSMAALASSTERRIAGVRDAFDFRNATGAELDERLGEFPPDSISRLSATTASGSLTVTLLAQGSDLTIEAGASFGASSNPDIIYSVRTQTVISAGATSEDLTVDASESGRAGNIASQRIDTILDAPSQLLTVTNSAAFTNGQEEETDSALIRRAMLYLQSLARCQAPALEYAALSYEGEERITLASLYEDPHVAGMSYLYIDDGSGTLGLRTATGQQYTGTATATGPTVIYHDAPAVNTLSITYTDPITSLTRTVSPVKYVSVPERGVIYLDSDAIPDGAVWTLGPYEVFGGPIAAIQRIIEGDPANPTSAPGWRAAGTRVRVYPPSIMRLDADIHLTPENGYELNALSQSVETSLIDELSAYRIGEPLFVARLIEMIMSVEGVRNIALYVAGTGDDAIPQTLGDIYPSADRVIRLGALTIIPSPEEI
jgi:uncharacterized phage protein gp47/JayE